MDSSATDISSKAESNFRCPVCRAGQTLQNKCRRCKADLSLVVLAHQRVNFLLRLLNRAEGLSAAQRQRFQSELELLSPSSLLS